MELFSVRKERLLIMKSDVCASMILNIVSLQKSEQSLTTLQWVLIKTYFNSFFLLGDFDFLQLKRNIFYPFSCYSTCSDPLGTSKHRNNRRWVSINVMFIAARHFYSMFSFFPEKWKCNTCFYCSTLNVADVDELFPQSDRYIHNIVINTIKPLSLLSTSNWFLFPLIDYIIRMFLNEEAGENTVVNDWNIWKKNWCIDEVRESLSINCLCMMKIQIFTHFVICTYSNRNDKE